MWGGNYAALFHAYKQEKQQALSVKFAYLESLTVSPRLFDTFVFGWA